MIYNFFLHPNGQEACQKLPGVVISLWIGRVFQQNKVSERTESLITLCLLLCSLERDTCAVVLFDRNYRIALAKTSRKDRKEPRQKQDCS